MKATSAIHPHSPGKEIRTYTAILFTLIVFTFITVGASYFDFGALNVIVAIVIATIKASLVALFFMHLRHDKPINAIIFLISAFMLALLLISCYTDVIKARNPLLPGNYKGPASLPINRSTAPAAPAPAQH
jgi:cytochrome c oxidase subunit IV